MRCVFFFALLLSSCHLLMAQGQANLLLKVDGIRKGKGSVLYSIYDKAAGFPQDASKAFRTGLVEVQGAEVGILVKDLPFGDYAISVMHDENGNRKMDTGMFGIPKEGYGASRDAKGLMGPPKFEDARIRFSKPGEEFRIRMRYF